jgi:hypothetical protein
MVKRDEAHYTVLANGVERENAPAPPAPPIGRLPRAPVEFKLRASENH